MKILHRYIFKQLLMNLALSVVLFTILFLIFDFFDRIDNIITESPSGWTVAEYFLLKIPLIVSLMLPVAMLVATLFTMGILSRNSEITAMRACGLTVFWLAKPLFVIGLCLSFLAILLNETLVPYSTRRVREIYNIDIKHKDKTGWYSQSNFWWRTNNDLYSVDMFDSRSNSLLGLSRFELSKDFEVLRRTDANRATYIDPLLGWTMHDVVRFTFDESPRPEVDAMRSLPLPVMKTPADFYDVETDPDTMSFRALRRFVREQARNGLSITMYLSDLYNKFAFPFINLLIGVIVLPFALRPARSGSMAFSILAAFTIGFSYYAVHSFSIALGRAEFMPPLLAAWTANIIYGLIGSILFLGAEAPH